MCVLSSYDLHKATKKFIAFEDIKDIAMRLYKSSSFLRRKFCYLFRTSKCPPFELLNYSWSDKLKGVHWRALYSKTSHLNQPQVRTHNWCKDFVIPSGKNGVFIYLNRGSRSFGGSRRSDGWLFRAMLQNTSSSLITFRSKITHLITHLITHFHNIQQLLDIGAREYLVVKQIWRILKSFTLHSNDK